MSSVIVPKTIPICKRLFDFVLIIPGLVLVSPLLGLIALVIWAFDGAPVFFLQPRPGYKGKVFRLIKFRTMQERRDAQGHLLPEELRISRIGRLLRATSLDELPELINVLRGEMSLVGPRPLLVKYLERYSPEQARRHNFLPGITGWAQVNGRNKVDWQERFRLDVWYVDHWSLWLDIKILAMTIGKTFIREGISPDGQLIMGEFMGDESQGKDQPDKS
jgi:sugar transferase EpsL